MENDMGLKIIIGMFIVLIMGAVLIGTIASLTAEKTQIISIANESFDLSSLRVLSGGGGINDTLTLNVANAYTSGWRLTGDLPEICNMSANVVLLNQSEEVVDYGSLQNFTMTFYGQVNLNNTEVLNGTVSNGTFISYTYCEDGYLVDSWNRSVLNLVPGFFALAILGAALYGIYYFSNQWGL